MKKTNTSVSLRNDFAVTNDTFISSHAHIRSPAYHSFEAPAPQLGLTDDVYFLPEQRILFPCWHAILQANLAHVLGCQQQV